MEKLDVEYPCVVIMRLDRQHFSLIQTSSGVLWFFFSVHFFPHMDFLKASFRHRSSFSPEGAERSRLWYPTETLCVGASPGRSFTLLASFLHNNHTVPPLPPQKCQNVFCTCVGEHRQDTSEEVWRGERQSDGGFRNTEGSRRLKKGDLLVWSRKCLPLNTLIIYSK